MAGVVFWEGSWDWGGSAGELMGAGSARTWAKQLSCQPRPESKGGRG